MENLYYYLNFIIHLDKNLHLLTNETTIWVYIFISILIFCETGLFMAIFLPEESLLFMLGSVSSTKILNIWIILGLIIIATFIGDSLNYLIGKKTGMKILTKEKSLIIKKTHVIKTQKYYEHKGQKTIIIGRTLPIIRTFIPFVVGMGNVPYKRFILLNMLGAIPWIIIYITGGYFIGNIPTVAENFTLVLIIIIIIPIIPGIIKYCIKKIKAIPSSL